MDGATTEVNFRLAHEVFFLGEILDALMFWLLSNAHKLANSVDIDDSN
jgi:hypothetical protein